MLGTEVVWHPESPNEICVYTTNNDFYLLSTDCFTMKVLLTLVSSLTVYMTSYIYVALFYSCKNSCYQRTLTCINNKMKGKCTWRTLKREKLRLFLTHPNYNKK